MVRFFQLSAQNSTSFQLITGVVKPGRISMVEIKYFCHFIDLVRLQPKVLYVRCIRENVKIKISCLYMNLPRVLYLEIPSTFVTFGLPV